MIHYYINLDYTKDPMQLKDGDNEPTSKTKMIFNLMNAVGINRLFDQKSVFEFLFRTAILLREYGIMNNFFLNDMLLNFDDGEENIKIYLSDIIDNVGLEINDHLLPYCSRRKWMKRMDILWHNASLDSAFSRFPILSKVKTGENEYEIGGFGKPVIPDWETLQLAKLFAKEAIKSIGREAFNDLAKRTYERSKALREYRAFLRTAVPDKFDFLSIPLEIRNQFFELLQGEACSETLCYSALIDDPTSPFAKLMFLTWLYANNHIVEYVITRDDGKQALDAEVDPLYVIKSNFCYDDYEGLNPLGIGTNIAETFYSLQMDKLAHLLKGI